MRHVEDENNNKNPLQFKKAETLDRPRGDTLIFHADSDLCSFISLTLALNITDNCLINGGINGRMVPSITTGHISVSSCHSELCFYSTELEIQCVYRSILYLKPSIKDCTCVSSIVYTFKLTDWRRMAL